MIRHPFDYVEKVLSEQPEAVFLGDAAQTLTRRDALSLIDKISLMIQSRLGDQQGQVGIAINLPRDNRYIASIFAIWQLGHYFIPLNARWPKSHLDMILQKSNPALVISDIEIDGFSWTDLKLSDQDLNPDDATRSEWSSRRSASEYGYLIYTSGSTGEQKGVLIGIPAYLAYIRWVEQYFAEFENNRALLITAELTFDITLGDIAFSLAFGTAIHVSPDPRNIFWHAKLIADRRIDTFYSVPSTIQRLFGWLEDRSDIDTSSLKLIVSGGDSFSPDLIRLVARLCPGSQFHNVYGPTEVTINCCATRVDNLLEKIEAGNRLVPIGHAFPHLKSVLIEPGSLQPGANPGELVVAGNQTMEGYFGDTELTARAFITLDGERYYRTGDLVFRDDDGYYFVIGRIGSLVKVRGYRINPTEIDNTLKTLSQVEEVKTVTFTPDVSVKLIVSFVVPSIDSANDSEMLVRHCRSALPAYMVPDEIVFMDQLPVGTSGKYDTESLKQRYLKSIQT